MRVLITTFGTRGDVQPYVALAGALCARGHEVSLAIPEGFRDLTETVGLGLHLSGLTDAHDAGPAPVYVGFGSVGFGKGAEERREAVLRSLELNRQRGILATGWGGLTAGESPSDDVLVVDAVPHDWLFERVAAVVHHGGAGSTAAGSGPGDRR